MSRTISRRAKKTTAGASALLLGMGLMTVAGSIAPSPAAAAGSTTSSELVVTVADLKFILKNIQIAEAHRTTETSSATPVLGTGVNDVPDATLPWGLRQVNGENNNLTANRSKYGAADQFFPRLDGTPNWAKPTYLTGSTVSTKPAAPLPTTVLPGSTDATTYETAGTLVDLQPRLISNLIADQSRPAGTNATPYGTTIANPVAAIVAGCMNATTGALNNVTTVPANSIDNNANCRVNGLAAGQTGWPSMQILNTAPAGQVGLPPYNSMFTFFGQFFDHGLDLVGKGAGTVYLPVTGNEDPLYNTGNMGLSRTNYGTGAKATTVGTNRTTPWVDQNQTYASVPSKQALIREYTFDSTNANPMLRVQSTGNLLSEANGAVGNWGSVKAQAAKLGLTLVDSDVASVPTLLTDEYGRFLRGPSGYVQIVTNVVIGGVNQVVSWNGVGTPPGTSGTDGAIGAYTAVPTGHAFLDDINPYAGPYAVNSPGCSGLQNNPPTTPTCNLTPGPNTQYDGTLLNSHFVTGDGRGNENIGLTSIHTVFHSEHDRLVAQLQALITANQTDTATSTTFGAGDWHLNTSGNRAVSIADIATWDGERLFQAARFINENEYQHLVFDTFVRRFDGGITPFVAYDPTVFPDVTGEFAQGVYRFGHSMLNETIARKNLDNTNNNVSLFAGFLNPYEFLRGAVGGSLTPADATTGAGAVARGSVLQVGNEIDEFVTGALRNNLVGAPLDLAALNIARGRDTGMPTLNQLRSYLFTSGLDTTLTPYASWTAFGGTNLRHPESLVNFIAAYAKDGSGNNSFPAGSLIANATSVRAKRCYAYYVVNGVTPPTNWGCGAVLDATTRGNLGANRTAFLAGSASQTGVDDIDLWIGGLAESRGNGVNLLGPTMSYVFRTQMIALQNGDRFYYLSRLAGTNLLNQVANNTLADMFVRNTDLTNPAADFFSAPSVVIDLNSPGTYPAGVTAGPPVTYTGAAATVFVGTPGADGMVGGTGADTMRGFAGNDTINGGLGADNIQGGAGDDVLTDTGNDLADVVLGGSGSDYIDSGTQPDINDGGSGDDFINAGPDGTAINAGLGNDLVRGGALADNVIGDEGDDWIDGGATGDTITGDLILPQFGVDWVIPGRDVLIGGTGSDLINGGGAFDLVVASDTSGVRSSSTFDTIQGGVGFDIASYRADTTSANPLTNLDQGVNADLTLTNHAPCGNTPTAACITQSQEDLFIDGDVEGLAGGMKNDVLTGDARTDMAPVGFGSDALTAADVNSVSGLAALLPGLGAGVADGTQGNFLFGGGGDDVITPNGGSDLVDGDASIEVTLQEDCDNNGSYVNTTLAAVRTILAAGPSGCSDGAGNLRVQIARSIVSTPNVAPGVDVAVFNGPQSSYTVGNGGTYFTVLQPDGKTTVLRNIEMLRFVSGGVASDVTPASAATVVAGTGPVLTSLSPVSGDVAGGQTVTLTGTNLSGATVVTWGTAALTPTAVTATSATVTAPAGVAGSVAVSLTTPNGTSSPRSFTYVAAGTPIVNSVSPTSGSTAGGQSVVLTGSGLGSATAITWDNVDVTSSSVINSATQITVTAPTHAAGTIRVTVTTPAGTSVPVAYTYVAPSSGGSSGGSSAGGSASTTGGGGGGSIWKITEVRPSYGSTAGGDTVQVLGWGMTGATGVSIGGVPVKSFKFVSDGQIEIVTPPGTVGWKDLTVWLPNGSVPAGFQYIDTPGTQQVVAPVPAPQLATAAVVTLKVPGKAATDFRKAPTVFAKMGQVMTLKLAGMGKSTKYTMMVKADGSWGVFGSAKSSSTGSLTLKPIKAMVPGTYWIKLIDPKGKAVYVKGIIS